MDPEMRVDEGDLVDVNSASADRLATIEGIGPVLAERIVAYRASHGSFGSVEELSQVNCIGQSLVERVRGMVTARETADQTAADQDYEQAPVPEGEAYGPDEEPLVEEDEPEPVLAADDEDELTAELAAYEHLDIETEPEPQAEEGEDWAEDVEASVPSQAVASEQEDVVSADESEEVTAEDLAETPEAVSEEPADSDVDEQDVETPDEPVGVRGAGDVPPPTAPREPEPNGGNGFWRGAVLVLLGGLLGVVLTLVVAAILTGTLDFAPRRVVNALSRNMDIMQANAELTWDRLNDVAARTADVERRVIRLEQMEGRIADLEDQATENLGRLNALDAQFAEMQDDLDALDQQLGEMDARVAQSEADLAALDEAVQELQGSFEEVQEMVTRFDVFFDALRDLLIDMQGDGAASPEPSS